MQPVSFLCTNHVCKIPEMCSNKKVSAYRTKLSVSQLVVVWEGNLGKGLRALSAEGSVWVHLFIALCI